MRSPVSKFVRAIPVALAVTFMVPVALPTVVEAQSIDEQERRVEQIVDELERLEEQARLLGEDYNEAIAAQEQLASRSPRPRSAWRRRKPNSTSSAPT
jgi:F0F1-type ATP synthase membrane subunit b/b'